MHTPGGARDCHGALCLKLVHKMPMHGPHTGLLAENLFENGENEFIGYCVEAVGDENAEG